VWRTDAGAGVFGRQGPAARRRAPVGRVFLAGKERENRGVRWKPRGGEWLDIGVCARADWGCHWGGGISYFLQGF